MPAINVLDRTLMAGMCLYHEVGASEELHFLSRHFAQQ